MMGPRASESLRPCRSRYSRTCFSNARAESASVTLIQPSGGALHPSWLCCRPARKAVSENALREGGGGCQRDGGDVFQAT